jgi:TRAP-type C4-dicarboxylate transport system substrate-binding protein
MNGFKLPPVPVDWKLGRKEGGASMKRVCRLLSFIVIAMFFLCLPAKESEAAPKIVIKAVTCWPVHLANNDYFKIFIQRVNEKAKGELEIQLLGGPEVVSALDQLKAASKGTVDMVHGAQPYYAGMVPEGTITDLAKPKFEVKAFRESGLWDTYVQAYLEKAGVRFLGNTHIGMPFYIMTRKPISKLEDVRGMKIRGAGGLSDVFLGELGIALVTIPSAEVYEGLQRGIVDGAYRNTISLKQQKEYEVMKGILYPPVFASYGGVWISEEKWNTIPKDLQTMINQVNLKEMQEKHGVSVTHMSDSDIAKVGEVRSGPAIKAWIAAKAPKYGLPIYEKMLPYIK